MTYPILEPADLQPLLGSDAVVIVDCRFSLADFALGRQQYLEGHIPGAHHLDMETDLSGPKGAYGGRHPLPNPVLFSTRMRECGVNADTLVIAYDDNRMAGASRLWWLMNYFGHGNVRVLNGGIKAWVQHGGSLNQDIPEAQHGNFTATPNPGMVADVEELKRDSGNLALIDAREKARFLGQEEPIDPVAGHIPGAMNLPWQSLTRDQGSFLPLEQQQQQWETLGPLDNPVVYCGSGVTACVDLLSLTLTGVPNARLYSGSWSDWCSYPDNPVATGLIA
ncbi:MAG: sulfurtransferase [Gammaproteobacteria bacterium]|nr:MAG: sulfurtransferase [Gammaproteobacteria bacterium]